jgi:hypothetical protein
MQQNMHEASLRRTLVLKNSYKLLAASHKFFMYLHAANSLKLAAQLISERTSE